MGTSCCVPEKADQEVKLTDLNPVFLPIRGHEGVTEGAGVQFDCPCGDKDENHRCFVGFANPIGPGPYTNDKAWQRTGDTFETLTLTPSIQRFEYCKWHGFITAGNVITV